MNQYVILLVSCFLLNVTSTFARNDPEREGKSKKPNNNSSFVLKAANCTPSTGRKFLEFNNVSALIETGGSMWQDRSRNDAAYEVPKGSGETVIYAGALWMGGTDVNNQLRIAALTSISFCISIFNCSSESNPNISKGSNPKDISYLFISSI